MPRMKVSIGGIEFKTQEEAKNYVRDILLSATGLLVGPQNPRFGFLLALVDRHHERTEKVGTGIIGFRVSRNPLNPKGIELYILRNDGSSIDISWHKCISGKPQSDFTKIQLAMRFAIKSQVRAFREQALLTPVCTICGNQSDEWDIDHIIPFQTIALEFLAAQPGHLPNTFDDDPFSKTPIFQDADRELSDAWAKFHKENAELRLTCATCNRSRPRD